MSSDDTTESNLAVTTQMMQRIEDLRSQVKFLEALVSNAYPRRNSEAKGEDDNGTG
jgi:hypothetical protein